MPSAQGSRYLHKPPADEVSGFRDGPKRFALLLRHRDSIGPFSVAPYDLPTGKNGAPPARA